jgi:hypothetical protein
LYNSPFGQFCSLAQPFSAGFRGFSACQCLLQPDHQNREENLEDRGCLPKIVDAIHAKQGVEEKIDFEYAKKFGVPTQSSDVTTGADIATR